MRRFAFVLALAAAVPALAADPPRDPFSSLVDDHDDRTKRPPLQRVPVDALRVEGVVDGASPRALVALPDGSVHVIRVGDAVGERLGRVRAIGRGRVVVVENLYNQIGEHTVSKHVLTTSPH